MKNRVLGILLVLVLLVTGTAMATGMNSVPSKIGQDTVTVEDLRSKDGTDLSDKFQLIPTEERDAIKALMAALRKHVNEDKQPVITFLPQTFQTAIQQQLEEGKKAEDLITYDCVPLVTVNYDGSYGDVTATLTFATPYQDGQTIFAMIGFPSFAEDGELVTEWVLLPALVNAEGKVEIQFDEATLTKLGQQDGLLMLLSEPLAE